MLDTKVKSNIQYQKIKDIKCKKEHYESHKNIPTSQLVGMGFINSAYIILIILPVYLTGAVQNGVVFTVAISLCYLLASKGAAFTSFKLSLLTLAFPQREFLFCFFLRLLFSSRIPFSSNGFLYSFTLNLSIAISCCSCSLFFMTV